MTGLSDLAMKILAPWSFERGAAPPTLAPAERFGDLVGSPENFAEALG